MTDQAGASRPPSRFVSAGLIAATLAGVAISPAQAATRYHVTIAAGSLRDALISLGRQAGVSVGLSDSSLAAARVTGFTDAVGVEQALKRLLRGLPARALRLDDATYRIIPHALNVSIVPTPLPAQIDRATAEIVVTASKRGTSLRDYPGTATILDDPGLRRQGAGGGTDAIVSRLPVLDSTQLGPGRNKLFIRGVADSSFNGPTQATVGQYLGDVRLTYAAPDPDLNLYDIASIEVLEGPQGTLYGAGSLGGILRVIPMPARLDAVEGSASLGLSAPAHGALSTDMAAMFNLPLVEDRIGVRAVAYRSIDGGYIDDVGRDLSNVNRTHTRGGRITVMAHLDGWEVDLGGVLQNINSADGQYAQRGLPKLTRRSAIAQPFDNDYLLGDIVISKSWGGTKFVSATGIVHHDVGVRYDFTRLGGMDTALDEDNGIVLISSENRISHRGTDGSGWVLGTSFVHNAERLTRNLGPLPNPPRITGVRNEVSEGALYGEATLALPLRFALTAGGRVSYDRLVGHALDKSEGTEIFEPKRSELEILPSAALSWRSRQSLLIYLRYQEGFRPGGLSVAVGPAGNSVQRFRSDAIGTYEAGARINDDRDRWDAAASVSYAHWEDIQADLVDASGLPYTTNIGTGRIIGFEISGRWRPVPAIRLDASMFLNNSRLDRPTTAFLESEAAELPNIAEVGARAGAQYDTRLSESINLVFDLSARYVGRSRLGVGSALDIPQGRYVDTAASIRIGTDRIAATLDGTNLFDRAGNRFSLGDPFGVLARDQVTPLRPRTIRVGLDARF